MCGISGIVNLNGVTSEDIKLVKKFNFIQKHRGPDDEGIYNDAYCILGHRRLAIIDLSTHGHQPFQSENGRFQLIFNGEIYNYLELRAELENMGWKFRTKTDTEVLLKTYQQFGPACLHKFNGMFAFAIYDTHKNELFLARDRFGVKPFYYIIDGPVFYFASEIKALLSIPHQNLTINHQAIFDYFVFSRTDIFDETFLKNICRIPKGHYAVYTKKGLKITQWWTPLRFIQSPSPDLTEQEICITIRDLLVDAVRLRMRSDVPVGSCLSGGLDSSILLGILLSHNMADDKYSTFTASFPGFALDETCFIKLLQKKYNFHDYYTTPTSNSAYKNLTNFVYTNDEPTLGASFYSQYEVMRLARERKITVLLDGQGGDENFAGYQYFHGFYLYELLRRKNLLKVINKSLKMIQRNQDILGFQTFFFLALPHFLRKFLLLRSVPFMNNDFFNFHINQSRIFYDFFDTPNLNTSLARHFQYKLEHLLRTEDRNSMAYSIETRLPYLDFRLVEFVLGIKSELKIKPGETKPLQKMAVGQYTISDIVNRTDKIGFATPEKDWLKEDQWQKQILNSADYCEKTFPEIFQKSLFNKLPYANRYHWKIIQLATWHQTFINK